MVLTQSMAGPCTHYPEALCNVIVDCLRLEIAARADKLSSSACMSSLDTVVDELLTTVHNYQHTAEVKAPLLRTSGKQR